MLITRTSIVDGVARTLDLPVTERQLADWQNGKLIQDVMPHLSADEREFIMTGMTPEQFEALNEENEGDDFDDDSPLVDEEDDEDEIDDLEDEDDLDLEEEEEEEEPLDAPDESETDDEI